MFAAVLAVHLLVCVLLVCVVLLQSGKGGGLTGGAFGGATQTVFGGRGATDFITWATIVLGSIFFLTSLSLAMITTRGQQGASRSLIQEQARQPRTSPAPAQPGTAPPLTPAPTGTAPAPATPSGR